MNDKFLRAVQERNALRQDGRDKDRVIKDFERMLGLEKKKWLRVVEALRGANSELENRRKDILALERRNEELRGLWEIAYNEETRLREELEAERQEFDEERQGYQEELESEGQKLIELKEEYENFLLFERDVSKRNLTEFQSELDQERRRIEDLENVVDFFRTHGEEFRQAANEWSRRFEDLVKYIQDGEPYRMLRADKDYLMGRSDRFTAITCGMIDEVLDKLRAANEAMMPLDTPDDVQKFLECCNNLVRELKRRIRGR